MNYSLVYITAGTREEATKLARLLVEERLAACANILGEISSVYWWEGKVETGEEVALLVKTRSERVDGVVARVREIHSYSCPCVVALPIVAGNPAFLSWIGAETDGDGPGHPAI
ncbi:MAG: divalent-cation tolerance protein CutA [Alphaproteobacteria bacterium]